MTDHATDNKYEYLYTCVLLFIDNKGAITNLETWLDIQHNVKFLPKSHAIL